MKKEEKNQMPSRDAGKIGVSKLGVAAMVLSLTLLTNFAFASIGSTSVLVAAVETQQTQQTQMETQMTQQSQETQMTQQTQETQQTQMETQMTQQTQETQQTQMETEETTMEEQTETSLPVVGYCSELMTALGKVGVGDMTTYQTLCPEDKPVENVCSKYEEMSDKYNADQKEAYGDLCVSVETYSKESTYCKDLWANVQKYTNSQEGQDYVLAKQKYTLYCEKMMPVIGFGDAVLEMGDDTENPFKDVKLETLEGKAIFEVYRRGIIAGYPDGTFGGEKPVNRAEAAKFLLLGRYASVEDKTYNNTFKDVTGSEWFKRYVVRAAELGVIAGYPDGTFVPAQTVKVGEFTKMISLAFGLSTDLPYAYTDVKTTDWYAKYAGAAEKYKMFPNFPAKMLQPGKELTRNEVAVAIYQVLVNM